MNPLQALAAFAVTMTLGYLMIVAAAAVAGAVTRGGRRERAVDAYEALAVSRFTIPVSLIVPVEHHQAPLSQTVSALLELNYPELEVIVVTDRIPDAASEAFKADWSLEPKEVFYRRALPTSPVHRIYGSERDDRLTLVEKAANGRADALNCGVSLARYRYVVSVPPGVVFDRDALLRLMSPALRDPGAVLAVTSYVERTPGGPDPRRQAAAASGAQDLEWVKAGDDYQRLSSIRSWMASRLAWHQLRCGVPPRDGIAAWRRDAVLEIGGFSVDAADAELDLLIRLQTLQAERAPGHVVRTSEVFGHAGTLSVKKAAETMARRQRALVEAFQTFAKSRHAGGSRRTMMFVMAVELLTPAAQVFVLLAILAGTALGWFGWRSPFYALLLLSFGYGLVSASALLLRGGTPGAPVGADLRRLLMRAPLEFLVYRPALVWARGRGMRKV
jgi:cellulose synthase/poly-beta-1,6-N-acetylglucosamine synthase-like glycosyltransferase